MAAIVTVDLRITVDDGVGGQRADFDERVRFASSVGVSGKREQVTLTGSSYNSFTVPTGAKLLVIKPASAAVSCILEGASADTGVAIIPASGAIGQALVLTLGTSPSVGITNSGSSTTAELLWY